MTVDVAVTFFTLSGQALFVCRQGSLAGEFMIDDRIGIAMGAVFGDPVFDVAQVRVEFLGLQFRIEDSKVRSRIAAAADDPLPVAVIGGEIEVEESAREVRLAPAIINQKMFN